MTLLTIAVGVALATFYAVAYWQVFHDTKPRDPYKR